MEGHINIAYGYRETELSNEEILNYFKLKNCLLNFKLCAKRKLSHSDVNTCVFFVKNETLKFEIDRQN